MILILRNTKRNALHKKQRQRVLIMTLIGVLLIVVPFCIPFFM